MNEKNVYRLLVGELEGKRPLGRPRHRLVDNFKMHLGEIRWGSMDWNNLAQDKDQWKALLNSDESLVSIKWLEVCEQLHNLWPLKKEFFS
jgi:hypothetical protein